jgi:hypothetical protein
MVIVEDLATFTRFIEIFRASAFPIIIPVFADAHFHPLANKLNVVYVDCGTEAFILPYCHNEALNLPGDTLTLLQPSNSLYTPYKKTLMHVGNFGDQVVDIAGRLYLSKGELIDETKHYPRTMKQMLSKFRAQRNVMAAMPLMVLVEYLESYTQELRSILHLPIEPGFNHLNNVTIPAITWMEQSGVRANVDKLVQHYGSSVMRQVHEGFVYSDYNPYTFTARVTNKFGKVNFAAINKSDGSREAFISRHDRGAVVHIDFEAFHVRMIGQLIGYPLPSGSLHEYFGGHYFGKDELTPEEYQASKTKTMNLLYGSEKEKEASQIPFFIKVSEFTNTLWTKAQAVGYIESSLGTGQRVHLSRVENPYPAKLFNYLLQITESEITMRAIKGLRERMAGTESKVTLYTYDSIMIDFSYRDGKELIADIVNILEQDGTYPVRVYVGPNYHDLTNVTDLVKKCSV